MSSYANIRFYSLHVHINEEPIDYTSLLGTLRDMEGVEVKLASDFVAVIDSFEQTGASTALISFFGGDPEEDRTYYDRSTRKTIVQSEGERQWQGKVSRVLFDIKEKDRIIAFESRRGGLTTTLLERFLYAALDSTPRNSSVEVTPIASQSFMDEISSFERIRKASIDIVEPNFSWGDHANRLYELAADSHAEVARTEMRADRGEALSQDSGIVEVIKEVSTTENPSIANASITGTKAGEETERTVSLTKHQEVARVRIRAAADLAEQSLTIYSAMQERIANIRRRR